MKNDIFSNHIGGASELTIIADIKPGFVPIAEPITYAARLRAHLRMLSALRRNGLESDTAGIYVGPIDMLQTLQYVRWTLIDNDTKMLLAVNFDRPFEPYVRRIVDIAGPLLDTILCHCVGFDTHSSDQGFDRFTDYAVRHQVPVELFAASAPNISVDDGDYYLDTDRILREPIAAHDIKSNVTRLRIVQPEDRLKQSRKDSKLALLDQGLNILRVMYENSERFPHESDIVRDDLLYRNLTDRLVPGLYENLAKFIQRGRDNPTETIAIDDAQDLNPKRIATRVAELLATYREPLHWFANPPKPRKSQREIEAQTRDTVQPGLLRESLPDANIAVLSKPFRATHACMLLLRVDDGQGGAAFLDAMDNEIWCEKERSHALNLSITHNGLKSLGVPESTRLKFPSAFREGMAHRAGMLGDTDCNHPKEWTWPKRNWPLDGPSMEIAPASIDIIIQMETVLEDGPEDPAFDKDHPLLDEVTKLAKKAAKNKVTLLHVETMQRRRYAEGFQGHLNFSDGISQPNFTAKQSDHPNRTWDKVKPGDLLLDHPTQYDKERTFPRYEAPLQNGTFQVIRKIRMDVPRFHRQAANVQADSPAVTPEHVLEKMIGRKSSGANFETGSKDNVFDFTADPEGHNTPLQSHIRRANPRTPKLIPPRILRRSFSYGPFASDIKEDDGADRGQMFIAYNANIAEQFEVIQRWISGGNSTGISSWHGDPMLAPRRPDGSRAFRFMEDDQAVTVNLDSKPMAILQWGLYAFTPSRNGLMVFAKGEYPETEQRAVETAQQSEKDNVIQFLQDADDENRHKRDAFWQDIRDDGKPRDLGDFGVAVACAHQVEEILQNKNNVYSVQEYRERMERSIGVQYLGVDDRKQHANESVVLSEFLNKDLTQEKIFQDTFEVASRYIENLPYETQSLERDGYEAEPVIKQLGKRLESKAFIHAVTGELSVRWFGIPASIFQVGGPEINGKPHCPRDFLASSYYLFTPYATDFHKSNAEKKTPRAVNALRDYIEDETREPIDPESLLGKLVAQEDRVFWTPQKMAEYISGSCFGLVGPVTGSFRSVFFDWIKEDLLWRLQQQMKEQQELGLLGSAVDILRPKILTSMSERPIADLLYRKTTEPVRLDGVDIEAGRKVVFSQRSAILDSGNAETFLFGGDYHKDQTMHKCPGKTMGLAILMGSFAAMMQGDTLWPEGPLSVRIRASRN